MSRTIGLLSALMLFQPGPRDASGQADAPATVEAVNSEFATKLAALEREHLAALFELALRVSPEESARAYRQALELAVARELYREAEPAAERVAASDAARIDPQLVPLATLVNIVAEADRGDFDQSRKSLETLLTKSADPARVRRVDPETALALGEAYFQRLAAAGRYDIARRECQLVVERASDPGVRAHFANRLEQLALLGEPAPEISGVDADGAPAKLSDFKGKYVLIDFWATWCPPCGPAMQAHGDLLRQHADKGFAILGVNLDAAGDDVSDPATVLPDIREFILRNEASWPNLVAQKGPGGPAEAYKVTEIPATFLVAPDGKIEHVELNPTRLGEILGKLPSR